MLSIGGTRSHQSQIIMDHMESHSWGLVIFDETHVLPARNFRKSANTLNSQVRVGLTATLVREDEKIEDLDYLVGPVLYAADWLELTEAGHIARVQVT
jgi:DNA excision repair protein ERCC-3